MNDACLCAVHPFLPYLSLSSHHQLSVPGSIYEYCTYSTYLHIIINAASGSNKILHVKYSCFGGENLKPVINCQSSLIKLVNGKSTQIRFKY